MKALDYQYVLDRVYRHFVVDQKPPGIVNNSILYHQRDHSGEHCPCAIGLFDTDEYLDASISANLVCPTVQKLADEHRDLLVDMFDVTELTDDDVSFLEEVQCLHDVLAMKHPRAADRDAFRHAIASGLVYLTSSYGLQVVTA